MKGTTLAAMGLMAFVLVAANGSVAMAQSSAAEIPKVSSQGSPARSHQSQTATDGAHISVIGGTPASPGEFPWMAYILSRHGETAGGCSGTVVSPYVVLTAGHCVLDSGTGVVYPTESFEVTVGSVDRTDSVASQVLGVSQVAVYPDYDRTTKQGDAALLVLASPTTVPSIPFATPADTGLVRSRSRVSFAGWGLTEGNGTESPNILHWGTSVIQRPALCAQRRPAGFFDSVSQFCAIDAPTFSTGPCSGDSGGPVFVTRADDSVVEIGISSFGPTGCSTQQPSFFTRVDHVSEWIEGWIDATQTPPEVLRLPTMTRRLATKFTRRALTLDFTRRFRGHRDYWIQCQRSKRTAFRCRTTWSKGPNSYDATVSVFYGFSGKKVIWDERFTIRWVNTRCYFESKHRYRCRIYTHRR